MFVLLFGTCVYVLLLRDVGLRLFIMVVLVCVCDCLLCCGLVWLCCLCMIALFCLC